jgi:hypothetical protein
MVDLTREELPRPLLRAFAPLHRTALGVSVGTVLGTLIFVMTGTLLLKGGDVIGPNLALLNQYFIGYSVSWPGAFVGLLWGLGVGFAIGWGFALTRNLVIWAWLLVIRSRAEMERYGDFLDHL